MNPPTATTPPSLTDPSVLAAAEEIRSRVPKADPLGTLPDVHPLRIPRHIAVIMDGNGRWAQHRGLDRTAGHKAGARVVRETLEECVRCGVEYLTLYSFSQENWKRPRSEVSALMGLCVEYLRGEQAELSEKGVRLRVIGDRDGLPAEVRAAIEECERATARDVGPTLCLALNYSAREEMARAARVLAQDAALGRLDPSSITPEVFASRLYTAGMPDPDLLIRTAGELRVSNYLLWQISYAEMVVTPTLWPDFGRADLHAAVREYATRNRKFGGLIEASHSLLPVSSQPEKAPRESSPR